VPKSAPSIATQGAPLERASLGPGAPTKSRCIPTLPRRRLRIVLREFCMYKGVNRLEALTFIARENGCLGKTTRSITRQE
jgi:hypothetical protein